MGYKMTTARILETSSVWHASAFTRNKCPRIRWEKGRILGNPVWTKPIDKLAIKKVSKHKERFALKQHLHALPFLLTVFGVDGTSGFKKYDTSQILHIFSRMTFELPPEESQFIRSTPEHIKWSILKPASASTLQTEDKRQSLLASSKKSPPLLPSDDEMKKPAELLQEDE